MPDKEMPFIDSHAHVSKETLANDVEAFLARAQAAQVKAIVNVCTEEASLIRGLELHRRYPWVYNAAATPPHDVVKDGEALFPLMEKHARAGDLVAVGETGLDYHYYKDSSELQKKFLVRYLHLALSCKLPIVIHCRDAFDDLFKILDAEYRIGDHYAPGMLHCFTGTLEEAQEVAKRGWMVSFSGIVTFKKSEALREIAKKVPLDQLLIETDTPYLAPQSQRGHTNEPSFLPETVACIAAARGVSTQDLMVATTQNATRFFNLPL